MGLKVTSRNGSRWRTFLQRKTWTDSVLPCCPTERKQRCRKGAERRLNTKKLLKIALLPRKKYTSHKVMSERRQYLVTEDRLRLESVIFLNCILCCSYLFNTKLQGCCGFSVLWIVIHGTMSLKAPSSLIRTGGHTVKWNVTVWTHIRLEDPVLLSKRYLKQWSF